MHLGIGFPFTVIFTGEWVYSVYHILKNDNLVSTLPIFKIPDHILFLYCCLDLKYS